MALATGDQHAILGGTTPAERIPLRRQRQVAHARQQAAQRATDATGIDPAEVRGPAGRSMAAHLRGDASATVRAWELCKTAGTTHVARLIGVHVTDCTPPSSIGAWRSPCLALDLQAAFERTCAENKSARTVET
jgi:hypothetical protein